MLKSNKDNLNNDIIAGIQNYLYIKYWIINSEETVQINMNLYILKYICFFS